MSEVRNTRVTFAYPYTDEAGKNHNPDKTAWLPWDEAENLLTKGLARAADPNATSDTDETDEG